VKSDKPGLYDPFLDENPTPDEGYSISKNGELADGPPEKPLIVTEGSEVDRIRHKYATDAVPFPSPMASEAFYGSIGKAVRIMEEHCEACPEALLLQLLVMHGNALGRTLYCNAGGKLFANEYTVITGDTGKGRKGTALAMVKSFYELVDRQWCSDRIYDGIQSGEAIIHCVRDERLGLNPKCKYNLSQEHEKVLLDEGVSDKRLLVCEEELATLLKNAARRGSTITETLRTAWQSPSILRNTNKNSPNSATGAHVSLIAHVTREELLKVLQAVDFNNGLANRILWCASKRNKLLPNPEYLDWEHDPDLIDLFVESLRQCAHPTRVKKDDSAKVVWEKYYKEAGEKIRPLNLEGILTRDTSHVLKIALIYASFSFPAIITLEHLNAALAVVDYCERSARWIFGDATGNWIANKILRVLQFERRPLSKTDISNQLRRNVSAVEIDEALGVLIKSGLINPEIHVDDSKKIEHWRAKQQNRPENVP
jgi:hypothetical protein